MRSVKNIGIVIFLTALTLFTSTAFFGEFKLTEEIMRAKLSEQELVNLEQPFRTQIIGKSYSTSLAFGLDVRRIYNNVNQQFRDKKEWDKIMPTSPKEFSFKLAKASSGGWVNENKLLLFLLTFGLGILGSLLYITQDLKLLAGIKNNGIYHDASMNRGWIGIITFTYLVSFFIFLYYFPYAMVNMTAIVEPVKGIFKPGAEASQWFLYGVLYCICMIVMGVRMFIKYRHNKYQLVRTSSVVFFQVVFAFLLVEIMPLFDLPGRDLKNAWPLDYTFLYDYNVKELLDAGHFGKFIFVWGIILALIVVPLMSYFFGKRWYCSWVCGCGGLAETLGDPYRQLSDKRMWAWKMERWMVHGVLVFSIVLTVFAGYLTYNVLKNPEMESKDILLGISAYDVRELYGFLIGSIFAGVIGTGFYPLFGNRTWCRFGCPLAAYLGLIQRLKSRFRITTNGGQCISCGNCSTYCEQGIDVRAYAQKGQNIIRASCVGCGICATVCPRGVLKLENGPEEGRFGNEGPIVLGNNGFELQK